MEKKMCVMLGMLIGFMLLFGNRIEAMELRAGISNFPASYQPYLRELEKKHPNWNFTALYTNLSWDYVISNENVFGKNLVPKSYSDRWKNTNPGEYNVEIDGNWVDSSRQAVEYTMDPRNFLNEVRIFQFEKLSYDASSHVANNIDKILYGTEFYQNKVDYLDENGNRIYTNSTYADLIENGARNSGVSAFHLASRIKQEVGPFLSHRSISGDVEEYRGLYNFYNIGATSSTGQMEAIKKGLQYAKDGNGASIETQRKYLSPWNTKEKSITGGGIFIGSSYISRGQNTIYLQKFHVFDNSSSSLFWHQYMTNVLAPYSESKSVYNGYNNSNLLDSNLSFILPIYYNMPERMVESPSINPDDYQADNTQVMANVSSTLNVRSGPGTGYESITKVESKEKMTRIAKGKGSGELWDRVILQNGIIGYVFQGYVLEVPEVIISQINLSLEKSKLNKGERISLQVEILPAEAKNQKVNFSSSNNAVAMVDENGSILAVGAGKATITAKAQDSSTSRSIDIEVYSPVTDLELTVSKKTLMIGSSYKIQAIIYPDDASNKELDYVSTDNKVTSVNEEGLIKAIGKGECEIIVTTKDESKIEKRMSLKVIEPLGDDKLSFDESLRIEGDEISNLVEKENTVKNIKEKVKTDYEVEIKNAKGEILDAEDLVGTGARLNIIDDTGEVLVSYNFILYGDVNGDGKINSIDLLVLQRHILELEKLEGVFYKAGNINKNGKKPSSLDCLLIQRHILGITQIIQ